jgi:hypothetical protein
MHLRRRKSMQARMREAHLKFSGDPVSRTIQDGTGSMAALDEVTAGFEEVISLVDVERGHVLNLVIARLVQRIVITEWRARSPCIDWERQRRWHQPSTSCLRPVPVISMVPRFTSNGGQHV